VVDEICNNPYASMNFTFLEEKLKNEVYGQPFITSESFLQSLQLFYYKPERENPLILSLNGGTGLFFMN
jgi:hypothetical protein